MSEVRRLPDGTHTRDLELYLKSWEDLANKVISFFPGYILSGFDPGLKFTKWGKNRFEQTIVEDHLDISVQAATTLVCPHA